MTRDDIVRTVLWHNGYRLPVERWRILSICKDVSAEWLNYSGGSDECIRRIEEMK